jgi:hypothetical protein
MRYFTITPIYNHRSANINKLQTYKTCPHNDQDLIKVYSDLRHACVV